MGNLPVSVEVSNGREERTVAPEQIQAQLEKIFASPHFAKALRLRRFLRFVVEQTAIGQADQLKEYPVGLEVFDRGPSFDPRVDSIVRVEAGRLRLKLKEYYETDGREDPLIIEIPRGSYAPVFQFRELALPAPESNSLPVSARPRAPKAALFALVLLAVVITTVALTRLLLRPRIQQDPLLVRLTGDAGLTAYPALSPDGKLVAYSSDRAGGGKLSIWIQHVAGGEPVRLTHDPTDDREPVFSPDGLQIAFRSERNGGGIYMIPTLGGNPRLIANQGRRPRFSPDGLSLVYWVRDEMWGPSKIYIVLFRGGNPRQLRPDFSDAHFPIFSPDGKSILFCGTRDTLQPKTQGHDWWITPLDSGPVVKTGAFEVLSAYRASLVRPSASPVDTLGTPGQWIRNEIVFSARLGDVENLWSIKLSAGKHQISGQPKRLTFGAAMDFAPSVSSDRMVFTSGAGAVSVWSLQADLNRGRISGEPHDLLKKVGEFNSTPSISEDGAKLVYISDRTGTRDVWFTDLTSGREAQLTQTPASEGAPKITPDGSRVAYRVIENPKQVIFTLNTAGGSPQRVCDDCGSPTGWSPDAKHILFEPGSRIPWVGLLNLSTGKSTTVFRHDSYELHAARFSSDHRWIAFHAKSALEPARIYVARFASGRTVPPAEWIRVTEGMGIDQNPCWSPDGNLLYFLSERDGSRCIWARRLNPITKQPAGDAFPVYHFHVARRSLLMNVRADPSHIGLSAGGDRLIFSMDEIAGNVWMMKYSDFR